MFELSPRVNTCLLSPATLGFSPICFLSIALRFSPVHCEEGVHDPLVASFLFVLADAEPCEECSNQRWVSPFACEDLRSSCLIRWVLYFSNYCGFWEYRFCDNYIKFASIHFTAARIVSTFYSTYNSHLTCSSTSMMADCRPLWVCSWTGVDTLATCWRVFAIFPGNMASNLR